VTAEEIAEIIKHLTFYVGWPNEWEAFVLAKEVWEE
jgi:4-carboxymuconolactone decarboxylase